MTVRKQLWPISIQDLPLQTGETTFKKKVSVAGILAQIIKTGHLSNTFQTEDNTMISQAWNPHTTMPLYKPKWTWSRAMERRRFQTVTMSVIKLYSNRLSATWSTCSMGHMTWRIIDEPVSAIQIFSVRHGNNWKTDQIYTVTNGVHTLL